MRVNLSRTFSPLRPSWTQTTSARPGPQLKARMLVELHTGLAGGDRPGDMTWAALTPKKARLREEHPHRCEPVLPGCLLEAALWHLRARTNWGGASERRTGEKCGGVSDTEAHRTLRERITISARELETCLSNTASWPH